MASKTAAAIAVIVLVILGGFAYLAFFAGKGHEQAGGAGGSSGVTIRAATLQGGISTLDIIEAKNLLNGTNYTLSVLRLQKTPDIIAALANNETDLAVIPAEMAGKLIMEGGDIKIVAVEMLQNQAVLVRGDSNITSPEMLEGRLAGAVVASGTYKIFKAYMKAVYNITVVEGEEPQEGVITVVNIPPGNILDALQQGQVDAVVIWEPFVSKGLTRGLKVLVSYQDLWAKANMSGDPVMLVWVARTDFIDKHPDALKAFLKAHDEAVDIWVNDKDTTKQILQQLYKLTDEEFNTLYQRTTPLLVKGPLTQDQVKSIREVWWLAWQGGYLTGNPDSIPDTVFYHG